MCAVINYWDAQKRKYALKETMLRLVVCIHDFCPNLLRTFSNIPMGTYPLTMKMYIYFLK